MEFRNVSVILTDIEGTTTSVNFVYEVLFPYFREHLDDLKDMLDQPEVRHALENTKNLAEEMYGKPIVSSDELLTVLRQWSLEDKKLTPLKTIQGILWKRGYEQGELKGHVYEDVLPAFEQWAKQDVKIAVFSSGSVMAQKLIFGNSTSGDLTRYLQAYFDTETGNKREEKTYRSICDKLQVEAKNVLFLSDIIQELEAADKAGMQTVQLVRPDTEAVWRTTVRDFSEISLN
ncbi:MAG: acireductone synthase [Bacteroidota bacterium]|jgi:enolase-phosphatase E1